MIAVVKTVSPERFRLAFFAGRGPMFAADYMAGESLTAVSFRFPSLKLIVPSSRA